MLGIIFIIISILLIIVFIILIIVFILFLGRMSQYDATGSVCMTPDAPGADEMNIHGSNLNDDSKPSPETSVPKNVTLTALGKPCPNDNWRRAKARGCVYDLMLSVWMHPTCYNDTLYQQYRQWMEWRNVTYWREPAMINRVSYEEAESGEHDGFLWAQGLQHHLHCSYVFDRIRSAEERTPKILDSYCRDRTHVDHCLFFNAVPFGWEIVAPNVTKIYQPYDVECLVDGAQI